MTKRVPFEVYRKRYGGIHPPELNETRLWNGSLGRYDLGLAKRYCGDEYGRIGAHSWRYIVTFVRNP